MTVGVFKCLGLFGNVCIVSQSTVMGYKMLLMFVCKIWARGHENFHDDMMSLYHI